MAAPAMVRESGEVWLGLQVQHDFGDASRDLAAVLLAALDAEPGTPMVGLTEPPGEGPRLQDLVADEPLRIEVHDGFDFWVSDVEDSPELAAALEQAQGAAPPTARLASVAAAYWTHLGDKEFLRWVMPEPEDALLDAFARLHVAGEDQVIPDARLIGMFRAHGVLAPVWELPVGTGVEGWRKPPRSCASGSTPPSPTTPTDHRAAVGACRAGQPAGHHPLSRLSSRLGV